MQQDKVAIPRGSCAAKLNQSTCKDAQQQIYNNQRWSVHEDHNVEAKEVGSRTIRLIAATIGSSPNIDRMYFTGKMKLYEMDIMRLHERKKGKYCTCACMPDVTVSAA